VWASFPWQAWEDWRAIGRAQHVVADQPVEDVQHHFPLQRCPDGFWGGRRPVSDVQALREVAVAGTEFE
jgi:hypothetical protein